MYLLGEPRYRGPGSLLDSQDRRTRGLLFMLSGRVFFSVSRLFISANLQGRLVWLFCLAFTLVWASESGVVFHAQARLRGEAVTSR